MKSTPASIGRSFSSLSLTARIVFSNKLYVLIAVIVGSTFWILFNSFDQLLILSPVPTFWLPSDAILGFALSNATAALMGIVVGMNVYVFRNYRLKLGASFFSGSSLSVISSVCVGCSSAGFALITTFGAAGVAASTFLSVYQLPIRAASLGLLVWAYYSTHSKLTKSCIIK